MVPHKFRWLETELPCSTSHLGKGVDGTFLKKLEQKFTTLSMYQILKKCFADATNSMPLVGIHVDKKLQFVEEHVEIMWNGRSKRLIARGADTIGLRLLGWNSRRGP
ncbi:hypothetical protein Tco_0040546 [Tanacetum coccineum]